MAQRGAFAWKNMTKGTSVASAHSGFEKWISELAGQEENKGVCVCVDVRVMVLRAPGVASVGAHEEHGPWNHCRFRSSVQVRPTSHHCSLPLCFPTQLAGQCFREELGAQRTRSEWPWNTSQVETEACLQWTSLPWRTAVKVSESGLPLHFSVACCLKCVGSLPPRLAVNVLAYIVKSVVPWSWFWIVPSAPLPSWLIFKDWV